jgi:small subunit ribosomal protein S2
MPVNVTMKDMLEAGVHFGHQTHRWNPKMKPYIYGAKNGIYIINLQKSFPLFIEAVNFVRNTVSKGQQILFVGTKRQAQEVVEEQAKRCQMPYVTFRWLGGMLTNFVTIRQSLEKVENINTKLAEGSVEKLPKKEVLRLEKMRNKLLRNLGGIQNLKGTPGAIFIVDPVKEKIAVQEARRLKVPVVAMVDTNGDPDDVDYPIPSNDDAIRAIRLFAAAMADAVAEGMEINKQQILSVTDKAALIEPGTESPVEVIVKRKRQKDAEEAEAAPEAVVPEAVTPDAMTPEAVLTEVAAAPEPAAPVAETETVTTETEKGADNE